MEEVNKGQFRRLDSPGTEILHCIYSRHHDGFVRQRHIEAVLDSTHPWVIPYVIQLIGEYVIEIVQAVQRSLGDLRTGDPRRAQYRHFVRSNPAHLQPNTSNDNPPHHLHEKCDRPS